MKPVIQRFLDPLDKKISAFRQKVCLENGADPDYFSLRLSYQETKHYVSKLKKPADFEEIWKFGHANWEKTDFESLECLMESGKNSPVAGLSGARLYTADRENFLRVCMRFYILKGMRRTHGNSQFCKGGLFEKHIERAKEIGSVKSLFMSVYPYNSKLKAHVKNLSQRRISPGRAKANALHYALKLQPAPKPILFHSVPQHLFFYSLSGGATKPFPQTALKPH